MDFSPKHLSTFTMADSPKGNSFPGADLAVSICQDKAGAFNVILRGKIEESLIYYADLIFLLNTVTEQDIVNIFITSPGGSVFTGMELVNSIQNSKAQVNTIIAGMAASIAAVIWLAGKERYVLPYSLLMIHGSSHLDAGKSQIVAERAIAYVKFSQYINSSAVQYGIITEEEFLQFTNDRTDLRIFGSDLMRRCKVWGSAA